MSLVLLLSTFWDAAAPKAQQGSARQPTAPSRQGIAASLLDTLAHVQFCRMRLSAYSVLLQSLLQTTANSAEVGCIHPYITTATFVQHPHKAPHTRRAAVLMLLTERSDAFNVMSSLSFPAWLCALVSRALPACEMLYRQAKGCWGACQHMRCCWRRVPQGSPHGSATASWPRACSSSWACWRPAYPSYQRCPLALAGVRGLVACCRRGLSHSYI